MESGLVGPLLLLSVRLQLKFIQSLAFQTIKKACESKVFNSLFRCMEWLVLMSIHLIRYSNDAFLSNKYTYIYDAYIILIVTKNAYR